MELSLNAGDRLNLIGTLPAEGDFITLTLKEDITRKVALTQKEITDWEVKPVEKGVSWNAEKVQDITIKFTDAEVEMIKAELKKLDDQKKLTANVYNLYKAFVAPEKKADEPKAK